MYRGKCGSWTWKFGLAVMAAVLAIVMAGCGGGGGGDKLNIYGDNGETIDGSSKSGVSALDPPCVVPPQETFAELGDATDTLAERWKTNLYDTLPDMDSSASVYQNESIKVWADQIFAGINASRAANGLPALKRNKHLDAVAQGHAKDMALRNFFAHQNPYGMEFKQRFDAINPPYHDHYGENAAKGQETAKEAVEQWVNSTKHRANIMNGTYTHTGVGVYLDPSDKEMPMHLIQVFVQFKEDPDTFTDWFPQE